MELIDQRTVSDIPALDDGRRRSSRLKGKVSFKNAGVCGGSSPASKEPSGSRKKGGRKKTPVLENVQSIEDSVEELKSDVKVEAFPQELAIKSENVGANAVDNRALAGSASTSEEPTLLHGTGEGKVAKVKKLDDLDISDESLCMDREGAGATGPVVDTRGDFCDSNIFENLQSIVNLHPEENVIHNEIPSVSKSGAHEMIEIQVANTSEVNLMNEGSRKNETGLVKAYNGGLRTEKSVSHDVTDLKIVQKNCETTAEATTVPTGSETGLVLSDFKEEAVSRGSNSASKAGDDTLKLNGNDGEDSSSVTSQDDIAHTLAVSVDKDTKVASGDSATGGVSIVASNTSSNDMHMVTSPELLREETTHSIYRKQMLVHSKEGHEDDVHVGSRNSSEGRFSRVSPSKSRTSALSSQLLMSENDVKQRTSNSISEGRAMTPTTFEATSLRLDEVEGRFLLVQKSDSLKSVNQVIGLSTGDVVGALKVESSSEVTRNLSSHTDNAAGGEDDSSGVTEGDGEKVDESASINSKAGWVKCDDCNKWRSIPVDLAEKIGETNAYWSCKENPNKQFADCSIPQVKSNEEINRDLGISESSLCNEDEDEEHDETCDSKPMYNGIQENGQSVWTLIKRNIFKHRSQKHQDADEAMVCQCAPPKPGEVGCGEDCLNRMLNVECLPQQCPCGPFCTNQQFQKRLYANVELFRCGKKGHGLRALENIPRGTFIIEYVGEVLDMPSFEARQKEYSMNSQKHFYFMTLSANEIIDACSKGNLGRFINHSCEPNCQTEKWMVDGEVCIGLFAIRDVKKGEEVTFDYNFVRVGGADAKKCECGANKCRGFIGVDPDTPQNVVDIDSDDGEDPEPIMLCAESDEDLDGNAEKGKEGAAKKARITAGSESVLKNNWKLRGVKRKFYVGGAKDIESPKKSRRVKTAAVPKLGSHRLAPSRVFAGSRSGIRRTYQSDVEEKLGELTNESGGLRKQRDTAKQYLKLLVLTAASGGSVNGAAACSARDLSMLLEALLKTQKLSLLKDIMNKNGLQMFHNLLKQFRKSFEKRPILRKLLKVLDYLAKNRVLTVEHIFSPPRSGTECFSDTLFDLSRHDDMEVQNMARTFRKLYVPPRPHKTITSTERPLAKPSLQQTPVTLSSSSAVEFSHGGSSANNSAEQPSTVLGGPVEGTSANPPTTSRRKRPSRWDTVSDTETATTTSVSAGFGVCHGASQHHPQGCLSEEANPSFTPRSQLPAPSASQQPSAVQSPSVPSDPSQRPSVSSTPAGIPGRPAGPFPPVQHHGGHHMVQPGVIQHQGFPPGHVPVGLPGHRQAIPSGPMLMGLPRGPMGNEVPPMSQRSYSGGKLPRSDMLSGPHPMQGGPLQVPAAGVHHTAFPYHLGQPNQASASMHGVPPVQWPSMYAMGGPMFGGPPLAPPPPPLPPSGIPWGHNGSRSMEGFAGNASRLNKEAPEASGGQAKRGYPASQSSSTKTVSNEPTGSDTAGEPPVPGISPTSLRGSRTSERTLSSASEPAQGSLRSHNESSVTRLEAPPHIQRDDYGARTTGNDFKASNCSRNMPNNVGSILQAHSHPDYIESVHDNGQRVMSWETPECSSFHHHVSGMVRARVEMKQLVHYKDFEKFCRKLTEVVTRKEIKKYRENKTQGMAKVILRSKLVEKVDAYVDLQIGLYSKSNKLKSGEGQS
nr:histone-lysine N-methyltransferase ASHH2-like isoform X2 [Physcomitrium patens]|eukprot:XP_024365673.1 histone-lysine N-methyltransferase ASHH2-like isoform X2 [Physcomitrella patens]